MGLYDTRGKIRDALRSKIWDSASVTYADSELDDQLNESAQDVGILLAMHKRVPTVRGEYALSTSGDGTEVDIPINDLHSVISIESDSNINAVFRDEKSFRRIKDQSGSGDAFHKGEIVYTLIHGSGTRFSDEFDDDYQKDTGYTMRFKGTPFNGSFKLIYVMTVPAIPTGELYDGLVWTQIPYMYRRWIVDCAAAQLAMSSNLATTQGLVASWQNTEKDCSDDSRAAPNSPTTSG